MNQSADSHKSYKVDLKEEQETLLITLYAKALDSRLKNSILNDRKANEIMKSIDYHFKQLDSFGNGNLMVVRAKQLDTWISEFLKSNPAAVVLNLGCGLDSRIFRISPSSGIHWFDVDYPEVIEVRKSFYSNADEYKMIASSITEANWLDEIACDICDKPVMIIAEGVLEYLTGDDVKKLLDQITSHFSHGQIAFDVMNSFAINSGKESLKKSTGAEHKWAVDNTREVDALNAKLTRLIDISVFESAYTRKLLLKYQLIYGVMALFPNFRNMIRLLLYEF